MVRYHLVENQLTERPDDFMAQTHSAITFTREMVVERMLQRGTLLTKTDILAVFNAEDETIVDIVKEGNTVAMPLFYTAFSISGVFESPMDSFDHLRHKLNINIIKGSLLCNAQCKLS